MQFPQNYDEIFTMLKESEQGLIEYHEVTPYQHNKTAFSPKLVNLLLTVSPQIETLTKILVDIFKLTPTPNSGVKGSIQIIDKNGVLSNLDIKFQRKQIITPYGGNYDWWDKNNNIKHDLLKNLLSVDFEVVMNSFAALAGLHKLVFITRDRNSDDQKILDPKNWKKFSNVSYYTHAFEIDTEYSF